MSSYTMDIELFINEVKKHPEIWNNNCEDNRSPMRRSQAWNEVAKQFIEDFTELSDLERNDVFKKLQSKWRNIRDSYVRHKRQNYAVRKKSYIYAKHLTFLDGVYNKSTHSGSDYEQENQNDADDWTGDADDEAKLKKMLFKSDFEATGEPLVDWSEPKRKKRSKHDTQIEFVETNFSEPTCSYDPQKEDLENEDRSFFLSLIPAVRDFDIDKKLDFRSEILILIKRYRQEMREKEKISVTVRT